MPCMYVCMYACMYVCLYECMYTCTFVCLYASMYVYIYIFIYTNMYACFDPGLTSHPWVVTAVDQELQNPSMRHHQYSMSDLFLPSIAQPALRGANTATVLRIAKGKGFYSKEAPLFQATSSKKVFVHIRCATGCVPLFTMRVGGRSSSNPHT